MEYVHEKGRMPPAEGVFYTNCTNQISPLYSTYPAGAGVELVHFLNLLQFSAHYTTLSRL